MGNDQKNEKEDFFDSGVIPGIKQIIRPVDHHPQIDHSKQNKFMESYIIQKNLSKNKENSNDKVFNSLKESEKEEQKKLFENKVKDYENNVLKGSKFKLNIENKKSENTVDNFNIIDENLNKSMIVDYDEENWYPFKSIKFNYLDDNMKKSLKYFMEKNMIYQDSSLNLKSDNDDFYNSLKLEIRDDLPKSLKQ